MGKFKAISVNFPTTRVVLTPSVRGGRVRTALIMVMLRPRLHCRMFTGLAANLWLRRAVAAEFGTPS